MTGSKAFLYAAMLAAALAFGVVMLGAYVRLSQAGLGCPDWPGSLRFIQAITMITRIRVARLPAK